MHQTNMLILKIVLIFYFINQINCYYSNNDNVNSNYGIYTNEIINSNLIIPRKVNANGDHISHNLTHFHNYKNEKQLHYHIPIDNETIHIELRPAKSFMAPMMVVERRRRDIHTRKKPAQQNCHYQGRVRGHDNSKVALSACNGIAGYIRTNKGDYWVEPSKHNHIHSNEMKKHHHHHHHRGGGGGGGGGGNHGHGQPHPHVIFKKSDVQKHKQQQDNVQQKLNSSSNNNSNQNNKHKKRRRKKRATSNCSTKEPKRAIETRIEWQPQGKVIVQGGRRTRNHKDKAKHSIRKRSISRPRHVETLLVADSSMTTFHQDGDVETYLLAIMNMVSSLYKDPTIGNLIHIVVVKMILLEDDESETNLNVTHSAESNLSNFCRWQRKVNPRDENDPHHHDVAILITRNDICSKTGCQTLGVANVGGMCRPDQSCSVNEDNGITLAHTIAHELGHNFGMYHDTDKIGCESRTGKVLHVMTPSFEADTLQVVWSKCSRRDITQFLDQGLGKCLDDPPIQQEFTYPELPPGAIYNADLQCRLQFNSTDETIEVCSHMNEICSQLWCSVDNKCVTLLRPAAPGTHCGKHKWCQNKECVPIEDLPTPVDGGWGNWSDYSICSRSCGAGVSVQTRQCDNPPPDHGGSFCVGERSRYKICNADPCPEKEPGFRSVQCTSFNNETFRGRKYTWLPFFDTHEPCELYCTDTDDTVIVPWGNHVIDGTPCNIGTNDMCISGICRKVGCDWIVDSNKTEDQCGVCGGQGLTCVTKKGEFNKKVFSTDGYYTVVSFPNTSRQISIQEVNNSKNFLAISIGKSDKFELNGDRKIFMTGEYQIAGATALYSRENELEILKIPGPILEEITLQILVRNKQKPYSVKYEYTQSSNAKAALEYLWKLGDWTACSKTCGGGMQHRQPLCYEANHGTVDDEHCWSNTAEKRPTEINRVCNEDPCPAHWWIGPWQLCPITCKTKSNPNPVKRRSIMCVDHNELALPDSHCNPAKKPHDTEPCGTILPYCDSMEEISDNNTL